MTRGFVEVFRDSGVCQPFRYRVRSANGQIVCQSEGYSRAPNARRAARRLLRMRLGRVIDLTK